MDREAGVQASELTVKKGSEVILTNLSFSVRPGVVTGLIGPSGSGKTTLMRAIVGVQKVNSGQLMVFNRLAGSAELRSTTGYVTQEIAIYLDLTVKQNLQYFATLVHASREQIEAVLRQVKLSAYQDRLASTLSGGQKARVSLAVALLGNPSLLVMDEPTVGLDPLLRRELWDLFGELAQQGKTVIVSSHVMDEAERCDQLLLLRDGKLLWHDSRKKLLESTGTKTVEAAFLKSVQGEERP